MKKTIYIIIPLLIGLLGFQSCNFNDVSPSDSVANPFQDLYGVEQTVKGAYTLVRLRPIVRLADYIADDLVQGGQAGGAGTDSYAWSYSAGTGDHNGVWEHQYKIINQANRIIKYAPELKVESDAQQQKLDDLIGQAYFLRAYAHFDLLRFFSDFKNENALGIPYMLEPTIFGQPGRDKVSICYDRAISDLTTAKAMLSNNTAKDNAYTSKVAADALLARIYLYRGKYAEALPLAQSVLTTVPMATTAEYAKVWTDESQSGVIWKRKCFVSEDRFGGIFVGQDHSSVFAPSKKYMAAYDVDNDIRASIFFGQGPDRLGNTVDVVKKYYGSETTIGVVDEKMLRSEEMKLIEIECLARLDKLSESNAELNAFRLSKINTWVDKDYAKAELLDEILLERRRELALEAHRLFDLRRFAKDIVRDNNTTILKAGDYRFIMPIPLAELEANGGITKADQNPGY